MTQLVDFIVLIYSVHISIQYYYFFVFPELSWRKRDTALTFAIHMKLFYDFLLQIFPFSIYVCNSRNSNHENLELHIHMAEVWHNISATSIFYFNCILNIPVLKWVEWVGWNCYFVEGERLCYIIPNYWFSSIDLLQSLYIHSSTTDSRDLLMVFKQEQWGWMKLNAPLI